MICGMIFGLFFIIVGIRQIVTGRRFDFSKRYREVTGKEAMGNGVIAILIGIAIIAIILLTNR